MRALTAQQKQVCALVGSGLTQKEAATQVGVGESTVSVWYNDTNGLGAAMADATREYLDRYAARLAAKAFRALENTMRDAEGKVLVEAADAALRRLQAIEKRQTDREKIAADKETKRALLELEREKFAASQVQADAPDGVVVVPPDTEDWQQFAEGHHE